MGHMRDVLRLDVKTVSPHYAGVLNDATLADGGGRTRHRVRRASPAPKDDDDDDDDDRCPRRRHRQATTKGVPRRL